jgi:hypothetical protein
MSFYLTGFVSSSGIHLNRGYTLKERYNEKSSRKICSNKMADTSILADKGACGASSIEEYNKWLSSSKRRFAITARKETIFIKVVLKRDRALLLPLLNFSL